MERSNQPRLPGELTLSWRIGVGQYDTEESFESLRDVVRRNAAIFDEVALFETITHHQYFPLDAYRKRMELVARRLRALREIGVKSAGINVLCTIGHVNEAWSFMPPLPYQPMVGHDGAASRGCACPNTPEMRAYVREKYQLTAQASPDFIWVDDDIRMHHHGVTWGCFCDTCLKLFAARAGRHYSREQLVAAFDQPDQGRVRELWIEQNIATLESLLRDVGEAIRAVDPKIRTGLMTAGPGWTTYSGEALERWCRSLHATKARPGGGFYNDATPIGMVPKALECSRQRVLLPPEVTDLQYELENFPGGLLGKSATAVLDECTLSLAAGLNGIAFCASTPDEKDCAPLLAAVHPARRVWEELVAHTAGLPTVGLWAAWTPQLMARRTVRQGEHWLPGEAKYDITRPNLLADLGLPLVAEQDGTGSILSGRIAESLSDQQLKDILCGGVLMDSASLEVLTERGLGHLTGVRISRRYDNGVVERYTADPLNAAVVGQTRDARIEFWGDATGLGDTLEPLADGVRVLATMEDFFGHPLGSAMTAFENSLGGRIVVMGYAPWMLLQTVGKRRQMLDIADWISRGRLPVRIDQTVRLIPTVRLSADRRKGAVVLLNASLDEISEATIHIRASATTARCLSIGQPDRTLTIEPEEGGGQVTLKSLAPWSAHVILI